MLGLEKCQMNQRYINLATNKIKRMITKKQKPELNQWQQDYIDAKNSPEYENAVKVCKQLGIISKNATIDSLPINQVGFILMIGMFFEKFI